MRSRNVFASFRYAMAGLIYALHSQRNLRFHMFAAIVAMLSGIWLRLRPLELAMVIGAIIAVMVAEMLNTAVETTIDLVTTEYHPLARIAKNVAAGAVLLTALGAVAIGVLIFGPYLLRINLQ